jgi:hypothetical protein
MGRRGWYLDDVRTGAWMCVYECDILFCLLCFDEVFDRM